MSAIRLENARAFTIAGACRAALAIKEDMPSVLQQHNSILAEPAPS